MGDSRLPATASATAPGHPKNRLDDFDRAKHLARRLCGSPFERGRAHVPIQDRGTRSGSLSFPQPAETAEAPGRACPSRRPLPSLADPARHGLEVARCRYDYGEIGAGCANLPKGQRMRSLDTIFEVNRRQDHETGKTSVGVIRLPLGQHVRQGRGDSLPMRKSVAERFPTSSNLGKDQGLCQAQAMS